MVVNLLLLKLSFSFFENISFSEDRQKFFEQFLSRVVYVLKIIKQLGIGMYNSSYVLYKDFLPQEKEKLPHQQHCSPHPSRVAMKDLLKEINKSKISIGQPCLQEKHLKSQNKSLSRSPNSLLARSSLKNMKAKNKMIYNFSYGKKKQKLSSSPQMSNKSFITLQENIPILKYRRDESLKTAYKLPLRHNVSRFSQKGNSPLRMKRNLPTELLKLDLALHNSTGRSRFQTIGEKQLKTLQILDRRAHKTRSNLLNPEELRIAMRSDRFGFRGNFHSRISSTKVLNSTKLLIGSSQVYLTIPRDGEHVPQELKSSKVIFQRKSNLRKQFLINVRKIANFGMEKEKFVSQNRLRRQFKRHESLLRDRSEESLLKNLTFHIRTNIQDERKEGVRGKRTKTEQFRTKPDIDQLLAGPIAPW